MTIPPTADKIEQCRGNQQSWMRLFAEL